jgi:hypothetical protein
MIVSPGNTWSLGVVFDHYRVFRIAFVGDDGLRGGKLRYTAGRADYVIQHANPESGHKTGAFNLAGYHDSLRRVLGDKHREGCVGGLQNIGVYVTLTQVSGRLFRGLAFDVYLANQENGDVAFFINPKTAGEIRAVIDADLNQIA